jgi:two-component system response regulator YesN
MYKVFIVDDEAAIVKSLCTSVDWESYNFEIAGCFTDPQEALAKLRVERIDLLITDVSMPVIDGLTLMKKAKNLYPDLKVIVVSAYDNFDYVKTALRNGAENYLLKPLNQDELIETLQKTVENIENDSLSKLYTNTSMMAFKSNILERWIRNSISEIELMERAELIGINLESPYFTVLLFQNMDAPMDIDNSSRLLHILEKSFAKHDIHFFISSTLMVIGILFSNKPLSKASLNLLLTEVENRTEAENMHLITVVGSTVNEPLHVSKSYSKAIKYTVPMYLGYRRLYSEEYPEDTPFLSTLCEGLVKFSNNMSEMQPSNFVNFVEDALDTAISKTDLKLQRNMFFSAAIHIYDVLQSNRPDQSPSKQFMDCLSTFPYLKSSQLRTWVLELTELAVGILNNTQGLLHPYVRKAIEYIYQESNHDISLKTIAAEFNVSPAYLGQLFRTQTGKYFNDYLTTVRLEYSKKLILETDMKLCDIAFQAGFSSHTYFNRIFKRIFGISPSEFRYSARTKIP